MARRLCASLRAVLLFCLLAKITAPAHAQQQKKSNDLYDTTSGSTESEVGGITKDEELNLEEEHRKILKRFRDGRMSSAKDTKSRYSRILELHSDIGQITEHDLGTSANALEGGMEEAALSVIGKKIGSSRGAEREKDLEKAADNAGDCKNGFIRGDKKKPCQNISAVLVDKGAAHSNGKDEEEDHRVYSLTDTARKKAESAGEQYGKEAAAAAGDYGQDSPVPSNAKAIRDKDGLVTKMAVTSGGVTRTVGTGANIDFLRDEASNLNDQGDRLVWIDSKSLKSAEYVGGAKNPAIVRQFSDIYRRFGPEKEKQADAEASKLIAEYDSLSSMSVCWDGTKPKETGNTPCSAPNPKDPNDKIKITDYGDLVQNVKSRNILNQGLQTAREQLKSGQKPNAQQAKREQAEQSKIQGCLQMGKWCYSNYTVPAPKNGQPAAKPFDAVSGDPGVAFKNTLSFTNEKLYQARKGPLDKALSTIKSADFGPNNAARDNYNRFKEQVETAQRNAAIVKQNTNTNAYKGSQFDPSKMSINQLFGRNAQRDAVTIRTLPMPTGPQNGGGSSRGNGGFSNGPRAPAATQNGNSIAAPIQRPTAPARIGLQ